MNYELFFLPLQPVKAPMAESVDASVSNTDRETCAGSTPARSTEAG